MKKKALKTLFQGKKNTPLKKSTKKHFCFLKTLAGRTAIVKTVVSRTKMIFFD